MTSAVESRRGAAPPSAAAAFAELLAEVLHADRVAVDSHFFDDLGADSLVMAHFCARVRKRGNLPPVSMRDVYAHPTIRRLAAALANGAAQAPESPARASLDEPTPTSAREYVLCGVLQAVFFFAYSYVAVLVVAGAYAWVEAGASALAMYLRLVVAGGAAFVVVCAV